MENSNIKGHGFTPDRYIKNWYHLAALIFLVVILIWSFVKIDQPAYTAPQGGTELSFTPFNDYLILMAGKHFQEDGYLNNYFLSNMTVGYPEFARGWYAYQTPLSDIPNANIFYTHYGSIDALMVSLFLKMGIAGLPDMYKIMSLFSVIALALWYLLATRLFSNPIALISLITMGTSLSFLHFIDNISVYTYDILLAFGAALLFLWIEQKKDTSGLKRKIAYAGVWMLVFLLMSNSPEFVPWLVIFILGYLWINSGKQVWKRWKTAIIVVSGPVFAELVHFFQVSMALGGAHNTIVDFTAALTRRTTGFGLAEEIGYRSFSIPDAVRKIDGDLWNTLHFNFVFLVMLLVFTWLLARQFKKDPSGAANDQAWYRWKLLLVFFISGISFWFLMLQSTVTNAGSVYRTILPFLGLSIGYAVINTYHFFRLHHEKLLLRVLILTVLLVILAPTLQDRLTAQPFQFKAQQQRLDMYYGIYPEEIKALGTFLNGKTTFGDIIITDSKVAETGHPRYPFPGYEYCSDRRIEVARNVDQAINALRELEQTRAGLPANNPAGKVSFYLLFDDASVGSSFDRFAQQVGVLSGVFYEADYWTGLYGTIPYPVGSSLPFPPRTYHLYCVDVSKLNSSSLTNNG